MRLIGKFAILTAALALIITAAGAPVHAIGEGWIMDFEKAKAQAAAENKHILMDFTGSDWCGWCIRLDQEVFSQEAFKEEAPKHFVLLALDFPRDKSNLSEEIQAQNERLQKEYEVRGFPTIFLTDAKGVPYAQTGYREGGVDVYLPHLKELKNNLAETEALIKKAGEKTEDDEERSDADKARILDEALSKVQAWGIIQKRYPEVVDQIVALDKENAQGLKNKYEGKKTVGEIQALVQQRDFAAALQKAETVLKDLAPTGQLAQDLLFMKGEAQFNLNDRAGMRASMNLALEAAPEGERAALIKNILERFPAEEAEQE